MRKYNLERANQGKRSEGRTPYKTFTIGVKKYSAMVYDGEIAGGGILKSPTVGDEKKFEMSQEQDNFLQ